MKALVSAVSPGKLLQERVMQTPPLLRHVVNADERCTKSG